MRKSALEDLTDAQRAILQDCSIALNESTSSTDSIYRRHAALLGVPVEVMRVLVHVRPTEDRLHAAWAKLPPEPDPNAPGTPLFDEAKGGDS